MINIDINIIFLDYLVKYNWFFPLKHKYDTNAIFVRHKVLIEKHFKSPILHLYCDYGGEYLTLRDFLSLEGITWLTTPTHTLQHKGCYERHYRHIIETELSLLTHASMPITY